MESVTEQAPQEQAPVEEPKKTFDAKELLASLKSASLKDAPRIVSTFLGVMFGWVMSSLQIAQQTSPFLSLLIGFMPEIRSMASGAIEKEMAGASIPAMKIQISKAFDVSELMKAMEENGIQDVAQFINDDMSVFFDWMKSSMASGSPIEQLFVPIISSLEGMMISEMQKFEASMEEKLKAQEAAQAPDTDKASEEHS